MKLAICIPVYNNIDLCRQCLHSLEVQTFKDFEVVIVQDGGSNDYSPLLAEFPKLRLTLRKNPERLGAMGNILHTILYPGDTEYSMSMHEDDMLHPQYVELALRLLDREPEAAFVGSNGVFFDVLEDIKSPLQQNLSEAFWQACTAPDFVRFLLAGNPFMLASVIFRRRAFTAAIKPDLERFSVACDRPFLTDLIQGGTAFAFKDPLFFARRHGKKDMRGRDMNFNHVFALFEYYRSCLPSPLSTSDQHLFYTSTTNNLLMTYRSLFPDKRSNIFAYLREGKKRDLIRLEYINRVGYFGLLSVALGTHLSFYFMNVRNRLKSFIARYR